MLDGIPAILYIAFGLTVAILTVWGFCRAIRNSFGTANEYIQESFLKIVAYFCIALFPPLPSVYFPLLPFFHRSKDELLSRRRAIIEGFTAEQLYDAVENVILTHNLTEDEWVTNTWRAYSKDEWIRYFETHEKDLRQYILDTPDVRILPDGSDLHAEWVAVIQKYEYRKGEQTPAATDEREPESPLPEGGQPSAAGIEEAPAYQVILPGGVVNGSSYESVSARLQERLSIDSGKAERLLADGETVVKKGVSKQQAEKLQRMFQDIGAVCTLRPDLDLSFDE